jgi:GIY-YIG catalytic domain
MSAELIRTNETDAVWRSKLHAFVSSAHKVNRGLLIDYVFEPPDHIVPQRLYRYDVFTDYASRHRDDFEFGYDLITGARVLTKNRSYGVYVIELDHNPNHVYVGQTWYEPEERLAQHNTGFAAFHAARPFKHGARGQLRPDLYKHIARFRSQAQAEAMESRCALDLRKAGFRVEGGH